MMDQPLALWLPCLPASAAAELFDKPCPGELSQKRDPGEAEGKRGCVAAQRGRQRS